MSGIISVNVKKIKATAKVNSLVGENYRGEENAKKYDDGHRIIDTGKTKENEVLLDRPANYDAFRRQRIKYVNAARADRTKTVRVSGENERLRKQGKLQAQASKEAAATRKLRADTVDTLGLVVQPSADFINALNRADQTRFFRDSLEVMQQHPDYFGKIETAVIHYDENTPHMQCLASTINMETLTSDAKIIVGNKTKMSDRQTLLAKEMQKKGWNIERGMKRVNNPEYQNWKNDMEAQGYKVNRFNDARLMKAQEALQRDKLNNDIDKAQNVAAGLELSRRENAVKAGEMQLLQKQKEVDAGQKQLDKDKKSLQHREQKLSENEAAYSARVAALDARERALNDEREQFAAEKEKQAEMDAETERKHMETSAELDRRKADLDSREKSITNSKRRAAEHIKDMGAELVYKTDLELERRKAFGNELQHVDDFDEQVSLIETRSAALTM